MATREQLQAIVDNPAASPTQQVMARAQLSVLDHADATAKEVAVEAEISTADGTVRLRGFVGKTWHRAGGWRCHENDRGMMGSYEHDIPARVISEEYAEELNREFVEFGGCQGGEAQVSVEYEFTIGRFLASSPKEQEAYLQKFPTVRRDLFTNPPKPTEAEVAAKKKDAAQLAASRRLKELADSGRYDRNCHDDWMHTDCKIEGEDATEIVQLLAVILEDITNVRRRGETLDFKWRDMTKLLPKEDSVVKEQP